MRAPPPWPALRCPERGVSEGGWGAWERLMLGLGRAGRGGAGRAAGGTSCVGCATNVPPWLNEYLATKLVVIHVMRNLGFCPLSADFKSE